MNVMTEKVVFLHCIQVLGSNLGLKTGKMVLDLQLGHDCFLHHPLQFIIH